MRGNRYSRHRKHSEKLIGTLIKRMFSTEIPHDFINK